MPSPHSAPRLEDRDIAPSAAERRAWYAYRATAEKQGREVDEITFRDAWRQGCAFTFASTSRLSPAIDAFIRWMEYVTDTSPHFGEDLWRPAPGEAVDL